MGILDSLKSAAQAIFTPPPSKYKAPTTPRNTSALQDIKNALPSAAAAATAPIIAASGIAATAARAAAPIIGKAAAATGRSVTAAAAKNPILTLGGGLVAFGAIKENPKIVTEGTPKLTSGLVNIGENIGKFTENPSVDTAKKIYTDNPLIAGGLSLAGLGLIGGGIARAATGLGTISAVNKLQDTVEDLKTGGYSPAPSNNNNANIPPSIYDSGTAQQDISSNLANAAPSYADTSAMTTSYATNAPVKRTTSRKKSKTKPQNINIRNQIMIANKG